MREEYNQSIRKRNSQSSLTGNYLGFSVPRMTTGERVREARLEKGWTQRQLADASGVVQVTISKIERAKQKGSKFSVALATALGVRPQWLTTGAGPKYAEADSPAEHLAARIAKADARTRQLIELALLNPTDPIPEGLSPSIRQLLDVVRSMIPDAPHG